MNIIEAILLGLVQGITEFVPVSSSGHLIIFRDFLGISQAGGLAFDAVLQLATCLAVSVYFRTDLFRLARSLFRFTFHIPVDSIETEHQSRPMLLGILVGTLPALFLGLLLESRMETLFRSPVLVAFSLVLGSALMFAAERKTLRTNKEKKDAVTPRIALRVGFFQALALIPGFSRSGATISGGLWNGLTREYAARFSFLLSLPIIAGSGAKKLLELVLSGGEGVSVSLAVASIVAFVSGLCAIDFLLRYLKEHSLRPFIIYRLLLALCILITGFV